MIDPKLQAALDAVIQEGTFSLSAVEGVKRLRDENEKLLLKLNEADEENTTLRASNRKLETKCVDFETRSAALAAREKEVVKREVEIIKLECGVSQERAVAAAYKDCFGLVFRNQHVHRSISGNVPVAGGNNYGPQTMSMNTAETETVG